MAVVAADAVVVVRVAEVASEAVTVRRRTAAVEVTAVLLQEVVAGMSIANNSFRNEDTDLWHSYRGGYRPRGRGYNPY